VIRGLRGVRLRAAQLFQIRPTRSGDDAPTGLPVRVEGPVWSNARDQSDFIFLIVIVLAGTAAVLLRWSDLGLQSLWLDEGYTLWISRFSPREIWHVLRMDTTSPLYYVLMHYWSLCLGTSEFSLRALSAVFGTLSIPLFYFLARKILADRTAVTLAMILYAVSFLQVWYAHEARFYALFVFLSLGSVYCLLLCLENCSALRLSGLVLFLSACLYTHNMTFFYLPGMAVMWFVYPAERRLLARVRDGLLVCSVVLLLYVPWLPTLSAQLQRIHRGFTLATPKARDLLDSLCVLSGFDTSTLQDVFRGRFHTRLFGYWTWAPAVLMVFGLCVCGGVYAVRSADRRKTIALAVYALSPVALVFAFSRVSNPIYITRVFLGCCAVLPMVLAAPIAFQGGNRRNVFQVVGLLVLLGTVVSAAGYLRRERKEDWRGATEYLVQLPERERLAVIVPDIALPLVHYYAAGLSKPGPAIEFTGLLTRYDPPDTDLERRILQLYDDPKTDMLALLSHEMASGRYKEVDVAMRPFEPGMVKPMLEYLAAHCASIEVVEFHWVDVRRCSVRSTRGD
jgi:uncharacterized membrane protein